MNKVDIVVLGFLIRKPMHGYLIAEYFEKRGLEFWVKIKMPSVYKALGRLEKGTYISVKSEIADSNRLRKVYSITSLGRDYFRKLLDDLFFSEEFVSPFDFWNAFRFLEGNVSRQYFIKLIDHRLNQMELHKVEMDEKRRDHCNENLENPLPFYLKMLLGGIAKMYEAELKLLIDMKLAAQDSKNHSAFIPVMEGEKNGQD